MRDMSGRDQAPGPRRGPPAGSFECQFDVAKRSLTAGHFSSVTTPLHRDHADLCEGRCDTAGADRPALAGGAVMLVRAVQSYLSLRRATGFSLTKAGRHLKCFAAYSDAKGQRYVNSQIAIEWARQARSVYARARRLGSVPRFARFMHADDPPHEIPP